MIPFGKDTVGCRRLLSTSLFVCLWLSTAVPSASGDTAACDKLSDADLYSEQVLSSCTTDFGSATDNVFNVSLADTLCRSMVADFEKISLPIVACNTNLQELKFQVSDFTSTRAGFLLDAQQNLNLEILKFHNIKKLFSKEIRVRGNKRLKQQFIDELKKKAPPGSDIQDVGECMFDAPISSAKDLEFCQYVSSDLILQDLPASDVTIPLALSKIEGCLIIRNTSLNNIDFLKNVDSVKQECTDGSKSEISGNPDLCMFAPLQLKVFGNVENNMDPLCATKCPGGKFDEASIKNMMSIYGNGCQTIDGELTIHSISDSDSLAVFSAVETIDGPLIISGTELTRIEFPNLQTINSDDTAIEITNNSKLVSVSFPRLATVATSHTPAIEIGRNPLLIMDDAQIKSLDAIVTKERFHYDGRDKPTTVITTTATTVQPKEKGGNGTTATEKSGEDDSTLNLPLYIGAGVGGVVFLAALGVGIFCLVTILGRRKMARELIPSIWARMPDFPKPTTTQCKTIVEMFFECVEKQPVWFWLQYLRHPRVTHVMPREYNAAAYYREEVKVKNGRWAKLLNYADWGLLFSDEFSDREVFCNFCPALEKDDPLMMELTKKRKVKAKCTGAFGWVHLTLEQLAIDATTHAASGLTGRCFKRTIVTSMGKKVSNIFLFTFENSPTHGVYHDYDKVKKVMLLAQSLKAVFIGQKENLQMMHWGIWITRTMDLIINGNPDAGEGLEQSHQKICRQIGLPCNTLFLMLAFTDFLVHWANDELKVINAKNMQDNVTACDKEETKCWYDFMAFLQQYEKNRKDHGDASYPVDLKDFVKDASPSWRAHMNQEYDFTATIPLVWELKYEEPKLGLSRKPEDDSQNEPPGTDKSNASAEDGRSAPSNPSKSATPSLVASVPSKPSNPSLQPKKQSPKPAQNKKVPSPAKKFVVFCPVHLPFFVCLPPVAVTHLKIMIPVGKDTVGCRRYLSTSLLLCFWLPMIVCAAKKKHRTTAASPTTKQISVQPTIISTTIGNGEPESCAWMISAACLAGLMVVLGIAFGVYCICKKCKGDQE